MRITKDFENFHVFGKNQTCVGITTDYLNFSVCGFFRFDTFIFLMYGQTCGEDLPLIEQNNNDRQFFEIHKKNWPLLRTLCPELRLRR